MKYIAVFDVPDDALPDQYFRPRASFRLPNDYYKVFEASLKILPKKIPEAWEDPRAEGWNSCIDEIEM